MNLNANNTSWSLFGYASIIIGVPILLLSWSMFEHLSATSRQISWIPLSAGIISLSFSDRVKLRHMLWPFSLGSGKGSGRYLGLLGLLWYTLGVTEAIKPLNHIVQTNSGLLLIALSICWYLIRLLKFKESGI
jgi:hypothetical protein